MGDKRIRCAPALTLVEVVVATAIIIVAATGALSYEFYGARQGRMAKAHVAAARIACFLLHDWRANGGSVHYISGVAAASNPIDLNMGFVKVASNSYKITVDNIPMRIQLSRDAKDYPLIAIKATVRWRADFAEGRISRKDPSLTLTTYARAGQSSG